MWYVVAPRYISASPKRKLTNNIDSDFQYEYGPWKRGLSILLLVESFKQEVSEKLPQG